MLPTDILWREGMKVWAPAGKLKGLVFCEPQKEQDLIDLLPPPNPKLMAMYEARNRPPVVEVIEVKEDSRGQGHSVAHKASSMFERSTAQAVQTIDYAGFWKRLVAAMIDLIVLFIITIFFSTIQYAIRMMTGATRANPNGLLLIISLVSLVIQLWYLFGADNTHAQGSLGKQMMGIKVTDVQGNPMGSIKSIVRSVSRLVIFLSFGLSLLICAFTPRKQAFHDILAGTLVVNR